MIDTNGGNTRQLAGAQCFRRDSVLGSAWSGTTVPLGAPGTSTVLSFGITSWPRTTRQRS